MAAAKAFAPREGDGWKPAGGGTRGRLAAWLVTVATCGLVAAVWLRLRFANGPEQWQWQYRETASGLSFTGGLWVLVAAAAVVAAWRLALAPRARLLLLVAAGFVLTFAVVLAQPGGMERVMRSLVSRHTFSYVFDAGQFDSMTATLAAYPEGVERLSMHTRTHPPGPLLAIRALDRLVRVAPGAVSALLPQRWVVAADEALASEIGKVRARRRPEPHSPPLGATVVVVGLLLIAAAAASGLPLFYLARGLEPPVQGDAAAQAPMLAVALWLLVPARTLFTPSFDQAVPLLLLTALGAALSRSWLARLLAGLLFGLTCLMSYGYLAAGPLLLAAVLTPLQATLASRPWWREAARAAALVAAGFALPWSFVTLFGFSPWQALRAALAEHASMVVGPRYYLTWLVGNPYDFVLLMGLPVAILAARRGWHRREGGWLYGAWCLVLVALTLSGSVRGEAGRIWLFLMPIGCLFAAQTWSRDGAAIYTGLRFTALQALLLVSLAANMVFVI